MKPVLESFTENRKVFGTNIKKTTSKIMKTDYPILMNAPDPQKVDVP